MALIAVTARLRIQTWEPKDVGALCELSALEGIGDFSLSAYANLSAEQSKAWIEREQERFLAHRLGRFAVVSKASGKPIGISGLFQMPSPQESEVEMNYRYPRAYRGQGYATEAARAILDYGFQALGLPRINALADPGNLASQAVLVRLGMRRMADTSYQGMPFTHWVAEPTSCPQANPKP